MAVDRFGNYIAKLTNLIREDTIDIKSARYRYSESSDYNNRGLEKRIEQIEANLAKFARKDTKGAKTSQRQRSESSPFGGLEKRLDQIESLIAKLVKESKSRSGRIHTATADEQSNPIFSDDNASKPEDNDYNSDNSSAGSNSEKHDTHVQHSNKSSSEISRETISSKINNESKSHKVKQDNNSPSTCNVLSEKGSQ
ncbi:19559_t:CDS:2, partial [Funneliformis geosporum]